MSLLRPFKGLFVFLLHLLVLAIATVAVLSRYRRFHMWWDGFHVAVHFQIAYLVAILAIGGIYLALKRRREAIVSGLIATIISWPMLPFWVPHVRNPVISPGNDAPPIYRILTHNILGTSREYKAVYDFIKKEKPDAFLLVEGTSQWVNAGRDLLDDYPYEFNNPQYRGYGMIFMSKHPLSDSSYIPDPKADHPTLTTLIHFPDATIQLIGLHPPSPLDRPDLQFALENRHRKIRSLGQHRTADALIIAGDFNDTPWSPSFRSLANGSRTRPASHGHGLWLTWAPAEVQSSRLPFIGLPIDHILVSPEVYVHEYDIGPFLGSDHRAVIMDFSIVHPPR